MSVEDDGFTKTIENLPHRFLLQRRMFVDTLARKQYSLMAYGTEFHPGGPAALFWPDSLSISTYPTMDALKKVHCSSNSVHDQRVKWIDGGNNAPTE